MSDNEDESVCAICFEAINDYAISCSNRECDTAICNSCLNSYAKASDNIITCPNINCKREYLYCDVGKNHNVAKLVFNNITQDNRLNNLENKLNVLEQLKNEKRLFMASNLPICISTIANICFNKKLNKFPKNKLKENKIYKRCFHGFCYKGILDEEYKCNTCMDVFCMDCEKVKKENHVCNQNDLESVKAMNSSVRCPNPECGIPIFRFEGCSNMTCAKCKTMFNVESGKLSNAGSHNKEVKVKNHNEYKYSILYANLYDSNIINLLVEIEEKNPLNISYESILKKRLKIEDNKDNVLIMNLFKDYSKYKLSNYTSQKYYSYIKDIEELHVKEELTEKMLKKILRKIEEINK